MVYKGSGKNNEPIHSLVAVYDAIRGEWRRSRGFDVMRLQLDAQLDMNLQILDEIEWDKRAFSSYWS